MIRPRLVFIVLIALLNGTAETQAVDTDKLRRTVHLPTVSFIFGFFINGRGNFRLLDRGVRPEDIAETERDRKSEETDAEHYRRLGRLYGEAGQIAKSKETFRKAENLFRQYLQQHPDDTALRLRLADTLEELDKYSEAETLLCRAVKDAPNDWHSCLELAKLLDHKARHAITNGTTLNRSSPEGLLQSMRTAAPTTERIEEARRLRGEAVAYYDRAIALAPREPEVYRMRGASRFWDTSIDCGLRLYKGEKVDFFEILLTPAAQPDLRRAVDLSPDEYLGIGMMAMTAMTAEVRRYQMRNPSAPQPKRMVDLFSESSRKRLQEDMARLENGTANADKLKAAQAAEVLGVLQFGIWNNIPAAEKSLRRSIELDPSPKGAWDMLITCLMGDERYPEGIEMCRQRLQHDDSPHNRILLAKACADLQHFDRAEAVIRVGLMHEPNDFMLNLALADLLLMGGDSEALGQAGQILYKLRAKQLPSGGNDNRWANYAFACAIYFGLIGEKESAHQWLKDVQKHEPNYPRIDEALKALDD